MLWLDVAKGLAILIVVYFHFFRTYFEHGSLPPPDWSTVTAGLMTFLGLAWIKVSDCGFHAVGAFIILGGWAMMESTARRADAGPVAWGAWYRARLPAPLSNVLGCDHRLPCLAVRRAPRAGG